MALRFPDDFPPTDRWGKFFLGVRWLGPDLSFFRELKDTQARRATADMEIWGGGVRQQLAERISSVLAEQLGWKSQVFLPDDSADVAFHGPRFDFNDPEAAFDAVVEVLAQDFGIVAPTAFWEAHGNTTLGALVDDLLEFRGRQSERAV